MSNKVTNNSPKFSLAGIGIDSLNLINLKPLLLGKGKQEMLNFSFQFEFRLIEEEEIVQLIIILKINLQKEKLLPISEFVTSYDFKIVGLNKWKVKNDIIIPRSVAKTFISVGYGTLRGILWSKFADTSIPKIIIPIMNLDKVDQADLVFHLSDSKSVKKKKVK